MNLLWDIQAKTYDSAAAMRAEAAERHRRLRTPERRQIIAPVVKPVVVVRNEREGLPIELIARPRPPRPDADAHIWAWRAHCAVTGDGGMAVNYIKARCHQLGAVHADVAGLPRHKQTVRVRQLLMYEVHIRYPKLSLGQIGALFGGRDHTTVLHAIKKHGYETAERRRVSPDVSKEIKSLTEAGVDRKEIAERFGLAINTVRFHQDPEAYKGHIDRRAKRKAEKKARAE